MNWKPDVASFLAQTIDQLTRFISARACNPFNRLLACLDICPVMIVHGKLDQEVSISHGVQLHKAVPQEFQRDPWWVPDRGHNDITDGPGKLAEYIRKVRMFLQSIQDDEVQQRNAP
jgi:fermentation-respiration switch protein FrsA (DUF1100 family)